MNVFLQPRAEAELVRTMPRREKGRLKTNVLIQPNGQSQSRSSYAEAQKGRLKTNVLIQPRAEAKLHLDSAEAQKGRLKTNVLIQPNGQSRDCSSYAEAQKRTLKRNRDAKRRDIGDDEIRLISSSNVSGGSGKGIRAVHRRRSSGMRGHHPQSRKNGLWALAVFLLISIVCGVCLLYADFPKKKDVGKTESPAVDKISESVTSGMANKPMAYTEITDTVVDKVRLTLMTPRNASPVLYIGHDILEDTEVVLLAQAADIRKDNGEIACAYVLAGELKGRGQAKSGFCAIVNGFLTIGVANATPMLEQALATDGYFFRQYPLVVANQVVENKPKGRTFRKALVERNGVHSVVLSKDRLTFYEFSQVLVQLGANNAIYLVGASAYGFAKDADGNKFTFGHPDAEVYKNTNYIVWR